MLLAGHAIDAKLGKRMVIPRDAINIEAQYNLGIYNLNNAIIFIHIYFHSRLSQIAHLRLRTHFLIHTPRIILLNRSTCMIIQTRFSIPTLKGYALNQSKKMYAGTFHVRVMEN